MRKSQLSINHRHRGARTRAAGLLQLVRKVKLKVIAEQLGVSDQSVYNWAHAWRDRGVCAPAEIAAAFTLAVAVGDAAAQALTERQLTVPWPASVNPAALLAFHHVAAWRDFILAMTASSRVRGRRP